MRQWADIVRCLENEIPESEVLEYKQTCYGASTEEKRDLLKDVSAFANARGGYIVLGIEAKSGVPIAIPGIDRSLDLDAELRRVQQIVGSGLDPVHTGLRGWPLRSETGDQCLVLEVAASLNPPHRIPAGDYNRVFVRDSNGNHEASMPELRQRFAFERDSRAAF